MHVSRNRGVFGNTFVTARLDYFVVVVVVVVLGFHVFHSFLFSAFLFNSAYNASFRNSFILPNHFLPLGLIFLSSDPLSPSLAWLSPLSIIWPTQFFFLLQIT